MQYKTKRLLMDMDPPKKPYTPTPESPSTIGNFKNITKKIPIKIKEFQGEYRFFSNFWPAEVEFEGIVYPSVEHAYQASKTPLKLERLKIKNLTAGQAKRYTKGFTLTPRWEKNKYELMHGLCLKKFYNNPILGFKLIATANVLIEEGNYWHDRYWGVCRCTECLSKPQENKMGEILMRIRRILQMKG